MEQLQAGSMADTAFQYLNEGIRAGHWKKGDKLPSEAQLCRELSISRTSVRGALSRLAGLGLTQSIQGKGTFVCDPRQIEAQNVLSIKSENRLDVFEFRKIIESESAALAAIRATASDIQEMEKTITGMTLSESREDVAEHDMRFHFLISRASGNEIIQGVFDAMHDTYEQMFMTNIAQMHNAGVVHHRRIVLAIQTRDMDAARKCMLEHLDDTMRSVCRG